MVYHTAHYWAKFAVADRLIPDILGSEGSQRHATGSRRTTNASLTRELMTYQQAGRIAVIKRILGWVIFIPAVLSTLISVLKFMYEHSERNPALMR